MPEEVWNKWQLALYRNNIRINKLKKGQGHKVIFISSKKKKTTVPSSAKDVWKSESRNPEVLYLTLFNDEEIDLDDIKETALACFDKKKSALIEYEEGVSEKEISKVKGVLKSCGLDDVKIGLLKEEQSVSMLLGKAKVLENKEKRVELKSAVPWIRFSEDWLFVNGQDCRLEDLEKKLESIWLEGKYERGVEILVYPSSSNSRIEQIRQELSTMGNVEIHIRKCQYSPEPPPKFVLHMYNDRIKIERGRIIEMDEVAQATKEWIRVTGDSSVLLHVHAGVSADRVKRIRHEIEKGGIK
jgi:hypothetical protein